MKTAIYCRLSTEKQPTKDFGKAFMNYESRYRSERIRKGIRAKMFSGDRFARVALK